MYGRRQDTIAGVGEEDQDDDEDEESADLEKRPYLFRSVSPS